MIENKKTYFSILKGNCFIAWFFVNIMFSKNMIS